MEIFLSLVVLVLSVIAHEVAHGYAANSLGDPTARLAGRLTLNPLPHIDLVGSIIIPALLVFTHSPILFGWAKPVPYNPYNLRAKRWGETLVAVAGSATNILLAIIFGIMVRFGSTTLATGGTVLPEAALSIAATIVFINLFLGLFNLIPFPPLDGFTALRSALPWHLASNLLRFENKVRIAGAFSLILFLIVFSFIFVEPFVNLVFWLFRLLTGSGI
ncbi:site-2 protease family protein [Candidatus Kaiserbacteria bacterium]|nr:site-2 protease family protein [Candidatus Kaiserbacteria bacterium]